MTTKEQAARKYALSEHHGTGHYTDIQLEDIKEYAYLQGVEFSHEWIPVDKELPDGEIPCIVRNKVGNLCICFMKYTTMKDGSRSPIGWFNYWSGKNETRTNGPIRATITHWRYVEQ